MCCLTVKNQPLVKSRTHGPLGLRFDTSLGIKHFRHVFRIRFWLKGGRFRDAKVQTDRDRCRLLPRGTTNELGKEMKPLHWDFSPSLLSFVIVAWPVYKSGSVRRPSGGLLKQHGSAATRCGEMRNPMSALLHSHSLAPPKRNASIPTWSSNVVRQVFCQPSLL